MKLLISTHISISLILSIFTHTVFFTERIDQIESLVHADDMASNSPSGGRKSRVAHSTADWLSHYYFPSWSRTRRSWSYAIKKFARSSKRGGGVVCELMRAACGDSCMLQTVAESVIVHLGVSRLERLIGQGGRQKGTRSGGSWCTRPPRRGAFYVSPLSDARPDLKPDRSTIFSLALFVCVQLFSPLHSSLTE